MPWTRTVKADARSDESPHVPADSAAILDGLYAAVNDAGAAQREAVEALRAARVESQERDIPLAEAALKQATADLMQVGMVYRLTLHTLPDDVREDYLSARHPHLTD